MEEEPWLLQHKSIKPTLITNSSSKVASVLCPYGAVEEQYPGRFTLPHPELMVNWKKPMKPVASTQAVWLCKDNAFATLGKYGDFAAPLLLRTDLKTEHCGLEMQTESQSAKRGELLKGFFYAIRKRKRLQRVSIMLIRVPHLFQKQPILICDKTGARYE